MIEFFVAGDPVPQGSHKAFFNHHLGRAQITDSNKGLAPWRSLVALSAQNAMSGRELFSGPVAVHCSFHFARPKGHSGTGKNAGVLKENAPLYKVSKPDVDKLLRGILDSLTKRVFVDDSQVCLATGEKTYSAIPGAYIKIRELTEK